MDSIVSSILSMWQEQKWEKLGKYSHGELESQKNRDILALICACACQNCDDKEAAMEWINIALSWGADQNFVIDFLLLDTVDRIADIYKLLNLKKINLQKETCLSNDKITKLKSRSSHLLVQESDFEIRKIASVEVGEGWASNTVNTVIFRQHAIITIDSIQITAFYINSERLRVCKRCLKTNTLEFSDIEGNYNLLDAHNSISLGVDRENFLHICYEQHGTVLRYRRSKSKLDIANWTSELHMSGSNEDKITYPTFILPKAGLPLLILFRDGYWKRGKAYLKYFDEILGIWADFPTPILSGADNAPWTSNAYWNNPIIDNSGVLHLSFCWRADYVDKSKTLNNINIDYTRSYNGGYDWTTSKNRKIILPITQVNSETVLAVPPGSNLMNQNSMAVDSFGNPHIAFYSNDKFGLPQYKHLWFDGLEWHCRVVSDSKLNFSLSGAGTLKLPFSRPDIILDDKDNVYLIYRSSNTNNKFVITKLNAPGYDVHQSSTEILLDYDVAHAEPIIDKVRWAEHKILSLFIQKNLQPDGDVTTNEHVEKMHIVDFMILEKFNEEDSNNEFS